MKAPEPTDALTDKEIVERVLNGNQAAFELLFGRYRYLVFSQAHRLTGDRERAEDIVQEVFITAYQHLDRLREPAAFAKWLCAITRHKGLNLLRDRNLKSESLDGLREAGFEPAAPQPDDPHAKENLELIRRCIPRLPDIYREVVELRYTREFSYQKITEYLGISMSGVKSRLFHARKAIIKMLRKEGQL